MEPEDLFERVVENAIDFLEMALAEFEDKPKYSVIHFAAAVELFLKARLMKEHWSVIVTKDADFGKFIEGDFRSVSPAEAMNRLEKIAQDGLTADEREVFDRLSKHRNKIIHFFHQTVDDEELENERVELSKEQLKAWFFLFNLLKTRWKEAFLPFQETFIALHWQVKKYSEYLKIVYKSLEQEIANNKADGTLYSACPVCDYEAFKHEEVVSENLTVAHCNVCDYSGSIVSLECPNCEEKITILGYIGDSCSCGEEITEKDIADSLDDSEGYHPKHNPDSNTPAHCSECSGYESVIEHSGNLFCSSCRTAFNYEDLHICEFCSDTYVGNYVENTYWNGCVICDGKSGWISDRD